MTFLTSKSSMWRKKEANCFDRRKAGVCAVVRKS
ncbi:hypothetical protein NC652_007164 [Populus alba x Populus x berolinensis]|nr:hypothetical protein NC652_007164 [Populus alba x Populus x berolinensis]